MKKVKPAGKRLSKCPPHIENLPPKHIMGVGQKFSYPRKHPQKTHNISPVKPSLTYIFARKSAIFNK